MLPPSISFSTCTTSSFIRTDVYRVFPRGSSTNSAYISVLSAHVRALS